MRKKTPAEYSVFLLLGGLYSSVISYSVLRATIIPYTLFQAVFFTVLFLLLLTFVLYSLYTAAASLAVIAFAYLINRKAFNAYVSDLYWFIRGYQPLEERFVVAVICLICGVVALYVVLTLHKTFNYYLLIGLGAGVLAIHWSLDYIGGYVSFVLFLICFLGITAMKMNRIKGVRRNALFTLCYLPVCLTVATGSYFISGSVAVTERDRSVSEALDDFFYYVFNPKYFTFQTTGFGRGSGLLGGKVAPNDRFVMEVYADKPPYLSGAVKDIYTGVSWTNSFVKTDIPYDGQSIALEYEEALGGLAWIHGICDRYGLPRDSFREVRYRGNATVYVTGPFTEEDPYGLSHDFPRMDFLPVEAVVFSYDSDSGYSMRFARYSEEIELSGQWYAFSALDPDMAQYKELTIGGSRLATLFRPRRVISVAPFGHELYANPHGDVQSSQPLTRDESYSFTYLDVDFSENSVQDFLRTLNGSFYPEVPEESFLLPENLPQRVYDLAAELTEDALTNYDKVKALEKYVSSFPYTLSPQNVPYGADFVDFFLFEGREGYCTYYATALAVMARCLGLPSRYAEGYIMPPSKSGAAYGVTDRQAHAWAEVYFSGFGWAPFEATPAYAYRFYNETPQEGASIFAPGFFEDPLYMEYLMMYGMEDYVSAPFDASPVVQPSPAAQTASGEFRIPWPLAAASIPLGAILVYLSMHFAGMIRYNFRLGRIKRMATNRQAREYYRYIVKMTAYFNYPMEPQETPYVYAARMGKRFAFKNEGVYMSDLTEIYYRGVYGAAPIPDSEALLMRECYFELFEYVRTRTRMFDFKFFVQRLAW